MLSHGITSHTYVLQIGQTLWSNLPQVLRGALFFNLACLPTLGLLALGLLAPALVVAAVTIGPAWGALLRYEIHMFQGSVSGSGVFFRAIRQYWLRSAQLSLLVLGPLLALWATLPALRTDATVVWIGLGANVLGVAVGVTLALYAFPCMVQRNLETRACVRDALILASRYPRNSLGLLGLGILFGFATVYLSLVLLLLLPSVYGLFIVANCLLVLDQEETAQPCRH